MELKPYQQKVLDDLEEYLRYLQKNKDLAAAFNAFWEDKVGAYDPIAGIGMVPYKTAVPGVPQVCIKVPTAGGKTFIACNSLKILFNHTSILKNRVAVWLVPSITILEQTLRNLRNPSHPYRQKISSHFQNRVEIFNKDDLLMGSSFSPDAISSQLSIIVLSFDTLRIRKQNRELRKFYQENGQLASFDKLIDERLVLENTDSSSLINVLRSVNPVVIVDESHNAEGELSVDMLKNLNPSFILDLTATPRENANIISFVDALALKKEHMVKLPVIVYNHRSRTAVLESAIHLRNRLECEAIEEERAGGKYIRPIALFQAEANTGEDKHTFEHVKAHLVNLGIPEAHIKIKTADCNEIKNVDLLARDCPVRYIITVNALKEGWDCSFAYVLASLGDRSSAVDVEQILGRILRQPYVMQHQKRMLNLSFVLTASSKFMETLSSIVKGLNNAGFSRRDYRVKGLIPSEDFEAEYIQPDAETIDMFIGVNTEAPSDEIRTVLDEIERTAIDEDENLKRVIELEESGEIDNDMSGWSPVTADQHEGMPDISDINARQIPMTPTFRICPKFRDHAKAISLPQFVCDAEENSLFEDGTETAVTRESLLSDFKLAKQNSNVAFPAESSDLYKVDIEEQESGTTPVFMQVDSRTRDSLLSYILSAQGESRINRLVDRFTMLLGEMYPIADKDLKLWLGNVFADFNEEQIATVLAREFTYRDALRQKIDLLCRTHQRTAFLDRLQTIEIRLSPSFKFPPRIELPKKSTNLAKSLYECEGDMNGTEWEFITKVSSLNNVLFWHRNHQRKGFCLNGWLNHYPDFIVVTEKGTVLVLETKGGDRDNSDSKDKLELGQLWAQHAGKHYRYYMIFDASPLPGAHTATQVLDFIKAL